MLARALCLSQLRGSAAGRNRLGKFAPDEPLIAEQERATFIQRATHSANQILADAAQTIQLRTPTFCQFVGLARSTAVQIGNSRICHISAQVGLVHHQPALDPRIDNLDLTDLLAFTLEES